MKLYKFITILFCISFSISASAQTIDELKSKINERNSNIKQLEEEIKRYQSQIEGLGKEADSLKNTLASLDLSKKKLETNLAITQNKIENTNLQIKELSLQISDKGERIGDGKRVIAQSLSSINQNDEGSVIETLLSSKTFAEVWNGVEELTTLQGNVQTRIHELQSLKVSLEDNKKKTEQKKAELVSLQNDLANQKKIIAETVKEKNALLASTKNTEANYKKVVLSKQAQKEAYEREVFEYESALKIAIDPDSIPSTGSGVLKWPLPNIKITQYFGNTEFSTKNPQIYKSGSHNGVDFAASIGTPVKSALTGTISGTGNTGVGKCLSYGKWIMVKHANGLSTLYAHLSLVNVAVGQTVSTGETIGYSGNTGLSTGPHLHFGVYATEGVRITKLASSKYCSNVLIPYADIKAYLNPLSYL